MKILLVDDNQPLRDFAAEVLETAGHRVHAYDDGHLALAAARQEAFDLLVTDYEMPGLNGLAVIEAFEGMHPEAAVLLISSHCGKNPLLTRRELPCLGKPFGRQQLLQAIEEACQHEPQHQARHSAPSTPWTMRAPRLLGWAALALTAFGVFWLAPSWFEPHSPPSLPDRQESVTRSTTLEVDTPRGVLGRLPDVVRWQPADGAEHYVVRFETVDGQILSTATATSTNWPMPTQLAAQLHPNVAFYWQVEARDAAGELLALSTKTRFRVIEAAKATEAATSGLSHRQPVEGTVNLRTSP